MSQSRTYEMIYFLGEDRALAWYLTHGVFPPQAGIYDTAKEAIAAVAADDGDRTLGHVTAYEVVRALDLGPFVEVARSVDESDDEWAGRL